MRASTGGGRGRPRDPGLDSRILTATRDLVDELGYHHVSMESIAERAGVGKATVYRRWPTKAAVITDAYRAELTAPEAPDTGSVTEDAFVHLRALVETLTLLGDPSVVAAALAERGEEGERELRDILRARAAPGIALLRRGMERGELSTTVPVETVVDSWTGYLLYRIVFERIIPSEDELRGLVALLPRS
ncbi:TetR/AcrR family transcriptional regulator [Gordonia sp. CPCC 206044]|uniref:TetR/AcrR family transcriptional regulator n=1 Tax=Gordonia sp. CPCC 206044 TaxID=3140793 RepID=UPI003AF3D753